MPGPLEVLTEINLEDLVNAFGCQERPVGARLIRSLFYQPAQQFARQMIQFDADIGARGLAEAACRAEKLYARDVRVHGLERIPDDPCLFLANHPGLTDTLALFASLAKPDLKIIALNRPFLLSLPNLSEQLYYVTDDPRERTSMLRAAAGHLRAGGSILTFPAAHTEPDPDVHPGARKALQRWTDSAGVFLRLAPETAIVPVCVRGLYWKPLANQPVVKARQSMDDQQLLATALQLLANVALHVRPVTPRIQIGKPIRIRDVGSADVRVLHRAVLRSMESLIQCPPQGQGVSAL